MNILGTEYTLKYQSLDIYLAGCSGPHCQGCHNPLSWDFDAGVPYGSGEEILTALRTKFERFPDMIKNIMIFGGEPLDQDKEIFISFLKQLENFGLPIWIFTRYNLSQVDEKIKEIASYIKCGRYEEKNACNGYTSYGIVLSTSNQKVFKKGVDY